MTIEELERKLAEAEEVIRTLEEELAETNRGLVALAMDLEQRVDRRTAALRESEDRFRGLAEAIPQLVWASDAAGKTLYVNRKWSEYAGHEVTTVEERRKLIHPDDLAGVLEQWKHAFDADVDFQCEYRIRRHDGQYRWFLARSVIQRDAAGRIAGWIGSATDIHDLKQAQEALRHTAEDLARSNKDLEQFAYVASHDLQEPLRQVRAYVGLLLERCGDRLDGKAVQYFQFVHDGAARMSDLVQGLLDYSRVGSEEDKHEPISCQIALDTALANLQASLDESHARITHDDLPMVVAESTQLVQIFQNFVGNAIKFRRKGVPPEVHIGCRRDGRDWVLSVRDNGIGIKSEHHEKVFMIFQRLHAREKFPGTGIGLAICKKIVERHGGRIWIESEPGAGTTFCFTLPMAPAANHQ